MLQNTVHGKVACSRLPSMYMHTHLDKRICRHCDVVGRNSEMGGCWVAGRCNLFRFSESI